MEKLTSLQNPRIKNVSKLTKPVERKQQNRLVIEGFREIRQAIESGYGIETMFVCPAIASRKNIDTLHNYLGIKEWIETDKKAFAKMAYREDSDGLLAVALPKYTRLEDIKLSELPLVIVLESVEKPGNLGAILRTAEALNVDAILVCDTKTDIYNPNVIRSSLGCIFKVPVAVCTSKNAINWLRENNICIFAAALGADNYYHYADYNIPTAFVMGTEATGLSKQWMDACNATIMIPMLGEHDSLNVSVATAVLAFEAKRQRNFGYQEIEE